MSGRFKRPAVLAKSLIPALAIAVSSAQSLSAQTIVPSSVYASPQNLVAIDGARRLNLYCDGSGSPTVVLDAGSGASMATWRHVQAEIAKVTRACAYDRAGLGSSDAATRPSDLENIVDDLHRLVKAARIETPFVYVGHSLAGMVGLLYVATYPDDIAGAVLVDPSFAGQTEAMQAELPAESRNSISDSLDHWLWGLRGCLALARQGELSNPQTVKGHQCAVITSELSSDPDIALDTVLFRTMVHDRTLPRVWEAQVSEIENFVQRGGLPSTDTSELNSVNPSFGDKPLAVLTSGVVQGDPKAAAAWRAGHDRIAALSTRGDNTIVPGARHYVQIDRPAAVIDAVRRVVAVARLK